MQVMFYRKPEKTNDLESINVKTLGHYCIKIVANNN